VTSLTNSDSAWMVPMVALLAVLTGPASATEELLTPPGLFPAPVQRQVLPSLKDAPSIDPALSITSQALEANPAPARYDPTLLNYDVSAVAGENIDMRTLSVAWETTDLVIPGNAGLDMAVSRSYNRVPFVFQQIGNWVLGLPRLQIPTAPIYLATAYPDRPWLAYWQEMIGETPAEGLCDGAPFLIPESGPEYGAPWVLHIPGSGQRLMMEPLEEHQGSAYSGSTILVSADNWIAECIGPEDSAVSWGGINWGGFLVTSPDGLKYSFDFIYGVMPGDMGLGSHGGWLELVPTSVEDVHGNRIEFEYVASLVNRYGYPASHLLYRLVGYDHSGNNDGRAVQFSYDPSFGYDPYNFRNFYGWKHSLAEVWVADPDNPGQANTNDPRKVEYEASADIIGNTLDRVLLPEGLNWEFSIDADSSRIILPNAVDHSPLFALTEVRLPTGGTVSYEYEHGGATPGAHWEPVRLKTRRTAGESVVPGEWQYAYELAGHVEQITVSGPAKIENFRFYEGEGTYRRRLLQASLDGWNYGLPLENGAYMGRLINHSIADLSGELVSETSQEWGSRIQLGELAYGYQNDSQYYFGVNGYYNVEPGFVARKTVENHQTGAVFTTLQSAADINLFGQALKITETGVDGATGETVSRELHYDYFNQLSPWVNGKPALYRVGGAPEIRQTYSALGRRTMVDEFGIQKFFEYHPGGDMSRRYQIRGGEELSTTFADYRRGTAGIETFPEGGEVTREIADSGDVTSVTDSLGYTTSLTYDLLGRLRNVSLPEVSLADISVDYPDANTAVVTRGDLVERYTTNGFGSLIARQRNDLSVSADALYQASSYDAAGRVSVTSAWAYSEADAAGTGIAYSYDALDRITERRLLDTGSSVRYCYSDSCLLANGYALELHNGFGEVDQDGFLSLTEHVSFGTPSFTAPTRIDQQIDGDDFVTTLLERNASNLVTAIHQGGLSRYFEYDNRNLLSDEAHPESSPVAYRYDDVGNLISAEQAGRAADYSYDGRNRRVAAVFNDNTPSVVWEYDSNDRLVAASRGLVSHAFDYRADGQPEAEALTIDGTEFQLGYSYDRHGNLAGLVYPSGNEVALNPDAFGRATSVGGYADDITYFPDGAVRGLTYGNGLELMRTRTPERWLDTQQVTAPGSELFALEYDYDLRGNVVAVSRSGDISELLNRNYDGLARLTAATGDWAVGGEFAYTDAGDVVQMAGQELEYSQTTARLTGALADGFSRTFSYDRFGNMLSNSLHRFSFDAENNLINVPSLPGTSYLYDAFGRRVLAARNGELEYTVFSRNGVLLSRWQSTRGSFSDSIYLGGHLLAQVSTASIPGPGADRDGDLIPDFVERQIGTTADISDGDADIDADGLNNFHEYLAGTSPVVSDTDGDGMPDGFESQSGLSPIDPLDASEDADEDGLNNLAEYLAGSDPLKPDSDGDGIPDGSDAALLIHNGLAIVPGLTLLLEAS